MSVEILVVRGSKKANPTITNIPVVQSMARVDKRLRGLLVWPRRDDVDVAGSGEFSCELPDLGLLLKNVDVRIPVWKPKTHRDIAQIVFDTFGMSVDVNDIIPTAISYDPLPNTVSLKAMPDAKTVMGSVVVNIYQKVMDISEIITTVEVEGIVDKYPLTNEKLVLEKRYYGYDFTENRDVLKTLANLGPILNVQSVYTEMNAPGWDSAWSTGIPYNLYGIRLTYLGPTSGYPEANPAYTHCAVYSPSYLSTAQVPGSNMILHFNQ